MPRPTVLLALASLLVLGASHALATSFCPPVVQLGAKPTRLVAVVPAGDRAYSEWEPFLRYLQRESGSGDVGWLLMGEQSSKDRARDIARAVGSCINEKVQAHGYDHVTLIGHSSGAMFARYAFLEASGMISSQVAASNEWAAKVDRILLFASPNRGISTARRLSWLHSQAMDRFAGDILGGYISDLIVGSEFVAETRLAWIRYFGASDSSKAGSKTRPSVVQFWGTNDAMLSESDGADPEAFSGAPIVRLVGSDFRTLHRLEPPYAADPDARWATIRQYVLSSVSRTTERPRYQPRRVLFIVRGIRDSSFAGWFTELRARAEPIYGRNNIEVLEYGYFSAANFLQPSQRRKLVLTFRDFYAQRMAENPLTEFDFVGHSNGTYVFAHALQTTPSMRFRNVVLAAPVLPTDFDWRRLFSLGQVRNVRYDVALEDWPVGILCQALRAIGQSDIGPAGVVGFGEGEAADARVHLVGWHHGGHDAALQFVRGGSGDNLGRLLNFVATGEDLSAGHPTAHQLGAMRWMSRLTPYVVWLAMVSCAGYIAWSTYRRRWRHLVVILCAVSLGCVLGYVVLDAA